MSFASARDRYLDDAVTTATPARLLTLLYDRLCLDLRRAEDAARADDRAELGRHAGHAVEILLELRASLDVAAWSGGPALAAIYDYLIGELLSAQLRVSPVTIAACRELLEPLSAAWRDASHAAADPVAATGTDDVVPVRPASGAWSG